MNKVKIEQLLYGYNNGHTLIASSLEKKLIMQNDVEILSDASGSGIFDEYITCYPLIEDGYYAFTKTWYADEMVRPGCVWTHVLLINMDDLNSLSDVLAIDKLFMRPGHDGGFAEYKKTLMCDKCDEKFDSDYYNYLLYTIFFSDKRVIIEDESSDKYERTLFDIIEKMPIEILKKFSLCTNSITNRYVNNEAFSYQFTKKDNASFLLKNIEDAIQCKAYDEITEYPLWVKYMHQSFVDKQQDKLFRFCSKYNASNRLCIKEYSKLFYSQNQFETSVSLIEYIFTLKNLNDYKSILQRTMELLYFDEDEEAFKWFEGIEIEKVLYDHLSDLEGIFVRKKIKQKAIKSYAHKLYVQRDKKYLKNIFLQYIHGELNENGKSYINQLLEELRPNDLFDLFDMDFNICCVLVRKKSEFLLCKYIWKMDQNFQLEMVNCVDQNNISKKKEIISCIIENTTEDISVDVYSKFGKELLIIMLEYCKNDYKFSKHQLNIWIHLLRKHTDLYKELLTCVSNVNIISSLMRCVDSYKLEDDEVKALWLNTGSKNMKNVHEEDQFLWAYFLLPIVLDSVENEFMELKNFVFEVINNRLASSQIEYQEWRKIDEKLPQVEIEKSWDRCLRLRIAFNRN